jgi:N-acetylglutamate synthase-like GNAT family acetyltransferase
MPSGFAIRIATPRDKAAVGALLNASYAALMPAGYDAATLAAALPVMTRANPALLASSTYYVAERDDGQIIGCGGWTPERPGSGEIEPELAHIRHFATHPQWTGRGVGRAIYERCEQDARAAGSRRFECYASLNAEVFYAAMGFAPVRHLDVPMEGGLTFPSILMTRTL